MYSNIHVRITENSHMKKFWTTEYTDEKYYVCVCEKRHMCTCFYIQIGILSVSFALSKNKIIIVVIELFEGSNLF